MATAGVSDPSTATIAEVASAVSTDAANGLTTTEAAARLERDGPNRLDQERRVPAWRRLVSQLADPLIYLLMAAVAISLVAWWAEGRDGVPYDVIVIAVVIVANAILGFVQERRSETAVAALQRMAAARASVLRDGGVAQVLALELVVGDVLVLAEGDAVAADARVTASSLEVAEASLTGESVPVAKAADALPESAPLGDRSSMVYAGTAVTRGTGRAIVTATGMDTETGRIATMLDQTEAEPTPLQREIARLSRALGIGVLTIAAIVVASVLLTRDISGTADVVEVLLLGVALAVAAVPEGLPAVMSVVLALGVQRMARRNAIVKELSSVEALGSASVICSDKTGTLTQNRMTLARLVTSSGETVDSLGRDPSAHEARRALELAVLANDARDNGAGSESRFEGDPTEVAFLAAAARMGIEPRFDRRGAVPFSAERRRMSAVGVAEGEADADADADAEREVTVLAVKGAPDVLLARCDRRLVGRTVEPLDDAGCAWAQEAVARLSGAGMRTLAVAMRDVPAGAEAAEDLEHGLVLVAIAGLEDPPRSSARQAVADAQGAGIRVVMITGDHPATAAAIAADLGIASSPGTPVLTGADLEDMDDDRLRREAPAVAVYARVAPEHKLRIVDALQAGGAVVAMTGDGVNDAPALRSADIGVAMGQGGTEVAREAAAMILTDDRFATIVEAVREGRGILDNVKRFLRYMLASNLGEVLAVFLGVVGAGVLGLMGPSGAAFVPLLATQILWVNLLTDLGPALAISAEPYADDLMARRPRRPDQPLIDRRMWVGMAWTAAWMAAATLITMDLFLPGGLIEGSSDVDTARTAGFTVLVIAHLTNAFSARSETQTIAHRLGENPWLWGAVALSLALQIAVVHVPVLQRAFSTAPLTPAQWGACTAIALVVPIAIEARKAVLRGRDRSRPSART
ncbi:cation-translocating P-type ATPase [Demequina sp.]|uniref:cation-translocating P-type ATPase n=1 Tax=Demequina sp. TaxID=2050685 RepID=UPI0025EA1C4A|nr:cation-translocating P-type ATPase [Demequina sp.]